MRRRLLSVGVVVLTLGNGHSSVLLSGQAFPLRIVVVDGEDAVNVVQQKTAVAPVVEVRDRNDQPVSGALVRFAITKGRATFSGARALTVTTNAAGRAAVTGLAPTGAGTLQISATAAFQGQTAIATIVQTNVMTAAEAAGAAGTAGGAGAGGGAGGTSAGAGAGAGTGGGLSATTIGIVGGAVAGGAIAAKEILGSFVTYQGSFSMSTTLTRVFRARPNQPCFLSVNMPGTVTAEVDDRNGTLTGDLRVEWSELEKVLPGNSCGENNGSFKASSSIESPASNIQVSWTATDQVSNGAISGTVSRNFVFSGALNGDTITGTIGIAFSDSLSDSTEVYPLTTTSVTMQKR